VRAIVATAMSGALIFGAASLPLKAVTTRPLPGGSSRLDYASIDSKRHRLYISHLGGGLVIVFDTKARQVVTTIPAPGAHGVLVVPSIHRVFASATDDRQLVTIDARTNKVVARAPAGEYPDGIAYDSADHRIYVSDEAGGAEIVFGASGRRIGSVPLGGEAGNVQYDPVSGRVLVDVQSRNEVAVISTRTNRVVRRVSLPGCDHPHACSSTRQVASRSSRATRTRSC
jgi:DNA-binding beta-propeller fold protein YncE